MPDQEMNRRLDEFTKKLDDNSKDTSITKERVVHLENKLDKHALEHEEIKRHMQDTRQVLYFGTDRTPGLVEQALSCKMSRDAVKEQAVRDAEKQQEDDEKSRGVTMGWQGWLMFAVTVVLALASIATAFRTH